MHPTQSALWRMLRATTGATLLCVSLSACGSWFFGDSAPRTQGAYKVGNPYVINGVRYVPHEDPGYNQVGTASWYGSENHGKRTANGETFDMHAMSAAHTTLPMPSMVRVTNMENGRTTNLRVNDRGPFKKGRILDVSKRAAEVLGFKADGTATVRVTFLREESEKLKREAMVRRADADSVDLGDEEPAIATAMTTNSWGAGAAVAPGTMQRDETADRDPSYFSAVPRGGNRPDPLLQEVMSKARPLYPPTTFWNRPGSTRADQAAAPEGVRPDDAPPGTVYASGRESVAGSGVADAGQSAGDRTFRPAPSPLPAGRGSMRPVTSEPLPAPRDTVQAPSSEGLPPGLPPSLPAGETWQAPPQRVAMAGAPAPNRAVSPQTASEDGLPLNARNAAQASVPAAGPASAWGARSSMFVQAGAFTDIRRAEATMARLSAIGSTEIIPVERDGTVFHRVRVGPAADGVAAMELLNRVVAEGFANARVVSGGGIGGTN